MAIGRLGVNSQNGAAQIGLDPRKRSHAEATKNTGAAATVTERGRFNSSGQFQ